MRFIHKNARMTLMNMILPHPIVYVTRDIERALGTNPSGNYFIITNKTPYAESKLKLFPQNIWLIESPSGALLDTYELLEQKEVIDALQKHATSVVVFQNTPRIEKLLKTHNIPLLNPSAVLSKKVEEKISQVEWLAEDAYLLPPHKISTLETIEIAREQLPFVLQFNHAHTGEGTYIIQTENDFTPLKDMFPKREARITQFVDGPVFTLNTVVGDSLSFGNISYQITGIESFTDIPFATIGNDWGVTHTLLTNTQKEKIYALAEKVGTRLKQDGWKGLFGIDVIENSLTGEIFLLEINARQPASTTLESILQSKQESDTETLFEKHILALMGTAIDKQETPRLIKGAQIVKRVSNRTKPNTIQIHIETIPDCVFALIQYNNTEHNKDLIRIQSSENIISKHNVLSIVGEQIASSFIA
jgi:ATP-grasp domain